MIHIATQCFFPTLGGIEGVITGRALYDGRLDLKAALAVAGRG